MSWAYIHKNREFKEFRKKIEETITQMQSSKEISPEAFKKIKSILDSSKN
jgi:hypothetical protein